MSEQFKIGIISDSHDHVVNVREAVKIFNDNTVEIVFHLGDFISGFIIEELRGLNGKLISILGESDGDILSLSAECSERMSIHRQPYQLDIRDKKILLLRSPTILEAVIQSGYYDLILYGETHKYHHETINKTTIINPGEACGYLTGEAQVVIFDLLSGEFEVVKL